MSKISYPNESIEYRKARNDLLKAELKLREQIERVAEQRRNLPPGGKIKTDYIFQELKDGAVSEIKLSELFGSKNILFLYSFMYSPDMDAACPMCTSLIDGLDGQMIHIEQHVSLAIVAKHTLETIHQHAEERGWSRLRLLSSAKNSFNVDYFGEVDGRQITNANVFVREGDSIRHFWGSEMTLAPMIKDGNMRHLDLIWPLWNVLDMTPAGRGQWYPALKYSG